MRLSTFLLLDEAAGASENTAALYASGLELCRRAERVGLDGVWVAEHHFRDFGGAPNPAVFLAAAARETSRVRLGSAVAVLPFRDPIQVVEDYAMVDALSGGRLDLGVGSGTLDFEFEGFGLDPASKRERFDTALERIERLWRGDDEVRLQVRPVQVPAPPIYVATTSTAGAEAVGQRGLNLLTLVSPVVEDMGEVEERTAAYRRGAPPTARCAVMAFAHVAADDAAGREAFVHFARTHRVPDPETCFERMRARGTALFGSEDRAQAVAERLAAAGADELILWASFGGLDAGRVEDTLRWAAGAVSSR